ncbi:LPS export ABC transporter periplasmic protein LptC [Rhodoferax sp.]|uniref:LPS export ABC transporter periplasmic protein LptC n=1 Tax=Rhodoferax sp. TaxID=50421 RepID=UPI0025FB76C5|nr:LPS export ABC transporter periplasmic protein LptC [Rhodoferax sp.]
MKGLLYAAWERLMLYLPVLVMGVLALGTYWLVRSTPVPEPAVAERVRGHEPDYFMEGFSVKTFDASGQLRSEVMGRVAKHFPDTKWLEIDAIRIRSFDTKGRLTTASAERGLANEDGSEVQLLGNALVIREALAAQGASPGQPRSEYRGEFLHAFMDTEQVKSHKPVELRRGQDVFTANSLEFDNVQQTIRLQGRVRGTLIPAKR